MGQVMRERWIAFWPVSVAVISICLSGNTALAATIGPPQVASGALATAAARPFGLGERRVREWSSDTEFGLGTLTFSARREKFGKNSDLYPVLPVDRLSAASAGARFTLPVRSSDDIGLAVAGSWDRRHPSGLMSHARALTTRGWAAMAEWVRDDRWALSAGWFSLKAGRNRLLTDRISELGSGAPLEAHGVRVGFDLFDSQDDRGRHFSFGLDGRLQRISIRDAALFGASDPARDMRVMMALGFTFCASHRRQDQQQVRTGERLHAFVLQSSA